MLVKEFIGRSIYGHLNFNIKFNRDISFLVGSNGSGKTTALRMMNALVGFDPIDPDTLSRLGL
ncbi:hypothetical protein [Aeromonas sanarellii]|uniref:hypothetical protein n=1 Tax=Aeromonas sanarellii TaxID=633415 RepID=UPI0038CFF946